MTTAKDSKLFHIIAENIPESNFTFLDRRYWSERAGHDYVNQLAFPDDIEPVKVILGGNYFAASSFAAVGILFYFMAVY